MMLWNSWINPNILHLGVKHRVLEPQIDTTHDLKGKVWWWLWMMNSNLNLAQPYIIPTMRHWKGWDAMNCSNQSKLKQSWCEKQTRAKPTLTPPMSEKHVVVSILEPIYQSPPSPTIHYTYNEKLEGLWCCEIPESIQTYSILAWNIGYLSPKLIPPTT